MNGRVVLLGDAAFVARPHTGMGVTKAALDNAVSIAGMVLTTNCLVTDVKEDNAGAAAAAAGGGMY